MKKSMILIAVAFMFSLFFAFNSSAEDFHAQRIDKTVLEPYAQAGANFASVQRPIYFSYDNPRYSPAYPFLSPKVDLQPYAAVQPLHNQNLSASKHK
jgi:hypothetical protein